MAPRSNGGGVSPRADENLEYDLQLKPVSRTIRCLAVGMGILFVAYGTLIIFLFGWISVLGVIILWVGLLMICLGKHGPSRPISEAPDSCVISSISLCLEFVGYPWDVRHLEKELRLNQSTKGTLLQNLFSFLDAHGIQYFAFSCSTSRAMRETLRSNRAPAIALIRKPILADPHGWGIVLAPPATIAHWFGKRRPNAFAHAVVIHGVVGKRLCVYDPATGTRHRVSWNWFRKRMIFNAFGIGHFLMVPPTIFVTCDFKNLDLP